MRVCVCVCAKGALPDSHQSQQSPAGVVYLGVGALDVVPQLTRLKVLPPPSVLHLTPQQEVTAPPHLPADHPGGGRERERERETERERAFIN